MEASKARARVPSLQGEPEVSGEEERSCYSDASGGSLVSSTSSLPLVQRTRLEGQRARYQALPAS